MKFSNSKFLILSGGYFVCNLMLALIGYFYGIKILEFLGFMFLAGTFLPFPADTYVLHLTLFYSPLFIALVAGFVNSYAVIFERYFVLGLLKNNKGKLIENFFNKSGLSKFFVKYPFLILFISAFSFIPFEAFRILAITNKYNQLKYFVATFLGRGIRYYLLAIVGTFFIKLNILNLIIIVTLLAYFLGLFLKSANFSKKVQKS